MLTRILTLLLTIGIFSCQTQEPYDYSTYDFEAASISNVGERLRNGTFTVTDLTQMYLNRIDSLEPIVNAMIVTNPDALEIAKQLDEEAKAGNWRGPLHGIPVILKDNIDTHDKMATTAGSRALMNSIAPKDAYIVEKLREAGAIILGKANLSEWANFRSDMSSSGWSGLGGQTNNPYKLDCNPCGSSAGSGAGMSSNFCLFAIGTETNGSIVCPSNANGIVGIKPTVGLLSRSGIIPISFTQDTPGPMAKSVMDAAIALGTMTGKDVRDSLTNLSEKQFLTDYTTGLENASLKGKRLGLYKQPLGKIPELDSLFFRARDYLVSQGAEIVEIEKLGGEKTGSKSFQVLLYEFKDGLNKYFAELDDNVKIRTIDDLYAYNAQDSIETGIFDQKLIESAMNKGSIEDEEYLTAKKEMHQEMRDEGIDKLMAEHNLDAFIAPTGGPAWKTDWENGDDYITSSSTPAAIAGYPNVTVPMGFIGELPVNISFFGKAWSEAELIQLAYAYEQGTKYRKAPKFLK